MPPVGFEPTISAGERPKTYALDSVALRTLHVKISTANLRLIDNLIVSPDTSTMASYADWLDYRIMKLLD